MKRRRHQQSRRRQQSVIIYKKRRRLYLLLRLLLSLSLIIIGSLHFQYGFFSTEENKTINLVLLLPTPTTNDSTNNDNNKNKNNNNGIITTTSTTATATAKTTTLWLLTCDTRPKEESINLSNWLYTAKLFKHNSLSQGGSEANVQIVNVCSNKPWKNFISKLEYMLEFLVTLDTSSNDIMSSDIVMFTDSDTVFNSMAYTADDIVATFYRLINKTNNGGSKLNHHERKQGGGGGDDDGSTGGDSSKGEEAIVISAEPSCFIARKCTLEDIQYLYPSASKRSNCPQFVNSGQYVGFASTVRNMLEEILDYSTPVQNPLGGKAIDMTQDQERLTYWYYKQQQQQQPNSNNSTSSNVVNAVLDYKSILFRSMLFGLIDSSVYIRKKDVGFRRYVRIGYNCGGGLVDDDGNDDGGGSIDYCGEFQKPLDQLGGYVVVNNDTNNNTNIYYEMHSVPDCEIATEETLRPF